MYIYIYIYIYTRLRPSGSLGHVTKDCQQVRNHEGRRDPTPGYQEAKRRYAKVMPLFRKVVAPTYPICLRPCGSLGHQGLSASEQTKELARTQPAQTGWGPAIPQSRCADLSDMSPTLRQPRSSDQGLSAGELKKKAGPNTAGSYWLGAGHQHIYICVYMYIYIYIYASIYIYAQCMCLTHICS
jgi:hypothetical protein